MLPENPLEFPLIKSMQNLEAFKVTSEKFLADRQRRIDDFFHHGNIKMLQEMLLEDKENLCKLQGALEHIQGVLKNFSKLAAYQDID